MPRVPSEPAPQLPPALPFAPASPVVIGLMGGVAPGKSAVAALFARHGLRHVDADRHAHLVLQQPEVVRAIAGAFGAEAVRDGAVDRQWLGARVFADPDARKRLEAITHPAI